MKQEEIDEMDYDPDDEPREPDYWWCPCCNHSTVKKPSWGGQCPKCSAGHMEEEYF